MERQSPRVILRRPRTGRFGEEEVLVLEMGLGGAKFEHSGRLAVSRADTFSCGPLTTEGVVVHSVLLPATTGMVYQTGVSFPALAEKEHKLLLDLLLHEAKEQVTEWESNLSGNPVAQRSAAAARQSAVAVRFLRLRLTAEGWLRAVSLNPNQPEDGLTIVEGTPEDEVSMLCRTYEEADPAARDLMRKMATVSVLEQMHRP